jgi:ribosomal protein S18 acetylase RimI-like enzyme
VPTPAITLATAADLPWLLGMMAEFNRLEQIAFEPGSAEPAVRELLARSDLGLVAKITVDGRDDVAGYFVLTWGFDLEFNGRDAFLTEIYIVPELRGQGLGKRVLPRVEQLAAQQGARALHLMVRHENGPAIALYYGAGFEVPPRQFMSKVLAPR